MIFNIEHNININVNVYIIIIIYQLYMLAYCFVYICFTIIQYCLLCYINVMYYSQSIISIIIDISEANGMLQEKKKI